MSDALQDILLFFERATQPCFMLKGDGKVVFKLPDYYYPDEFKVCAITSASPGDGVRVIEVQDIPIPDLSEPLKLGRDEQFSFFVEEHRSMAKKLIDVFMSMPTYEELLSICAYCQLRVNLYLFSYSLTVTLLHRPDTKKLDIPTFVETFPEKFVARKAMNRAKELANVIPNGLKCPVIDITLPEPKLPEHRMAYFREDVGINSHHWHWHEIYPTDSSDLVTVNKDRRGELFYYMHHQILARYNTERMCNGLERTKPYDNFREPIAEGYFPLLDTGNASRSFTPRFDNTILHDVDRPNSKSLVAIPDMYQWRKNILKAIEDMAVVLRDKTVKPLDEETGIDILGNMMEATALSVNPILYGDYHNQAHMLIAYVHDPQEFHSEEATVMGDSATAMRDPVFYRVHAHVDNILTTYKKKLPPYKIDQLKFPDISVTSIGIESPDGKSPKNVIHTLWERSMLNLKNGLPFAPERNVFARFTHLQHEEFTYVIQVTNSSGKPQVGTVRVFMAPVVDQDGRPLSFGEQCDLVIEMDKFSEPLAPGDNTIRRSSADSSVTIPSERIFRDKSEKVATSTSKFCDCGWPDHLLVPKGTPEGFPMVLFVMVSNWNEDKVNQDLTGINNDNASYCGLRDQKYPDRRPMGFPFDRKPDMEIFWQPNIAYNNCTIKFTGITRDRTKKRDKISTTNPPASAGTPKPSVSDGVPKPPASDGTSKAPGSSDGSLKPAPSDGTPKPPASDGIPKLPASDETPKPSAPGGTQQPSIPGGNQQSPIPGVTQQPPIPGGTQQPPIPGGTQQPPIPGGTQQPAIPGGTQQPPIPGGTQLPPIPGGTQQPAIPGGTQQPPIPGGTQQPPIPGGTQQPPIPGGTQQPPIPGGTQQPPIPGGTQQPAIPGGTQQPPIPGGTQQPPIPGGTQQPAIPGGTQQPAIPGGTQQLPIPGGTQQPPILGGTQQPPIPGGTQQPPIPDGTQQPHVPGNHDHRGHRGPHGHGPHGPHGSHGPHGAHGTHGSHGPHGPHGQGEGGHGQHHGHRPGFGGGPFRRMWNHR